MYSFSLKNKTQNVRAFFTDNVQLSGDCEATREKDFNHVVLRNSWCLYYRYQNDLMLR